ncbi:hypothetical protein [Haloferax sp. ATB1]|uniref:hypothetical protein n=1 Tax=Haloferax sp. ATB1 TaxID=1508454 RepID=UPI0005B2168E|nr:hypothetical protein [Haloferax sp. ATB1]
MSFVAKCKQCGVIERGDIEQVGDAAEDHEQFHDVRVSRVATDGGVEMLQACPECNESNVRTRSPGTRGAIGNDEAHYCGECGASFDDPVERPRDPKGGIPGHTLAARLEAADPEDLGLSPRGERLVTDGGRNESAGYEVNVDGSTWNAPSEYAVYDAIHAVAGALLAGADEVMVTAADAEPTTPERTRLGPGFAVIRITEPETGRSKVHTLGTGDRINVTVGDQTVLVDPVGVEELDDAEKRADECEPVTDGGQYDPSAVAGERGADRYHHQCADAVRTHAGIADQDDSCVNGTVGCVGPNSGTGELPCLECLLGGGGD